MNEPDFAFYSDVGGRSDNEDSYIAKRIGADYLFIVADGLGGHGGGEMASEAAVIAAKEALAKGKTVAEAIEFANHAVIQKQLETDSKMKTTITLAFLRDNETVIAHVGDSRVYAFKNGEIVYQTIDHSASQMAVSAGEITPAQIRHHADRNLLTRALGASDSVKPTFTVLDNGDYDALLLCSDGFWEYVLEEEMLSALESSPAADKWLYKMRNLQLERAPENCDNNTAVAVIK